MNPFRQNPYKERYSKLL